MRHRLVLTVLAATLALGGAVSAQSPSASPGASPAPSASPSPSPAATPFPYPLVPRPSAVDPGPRFEPTGAPDATVTRHGVRLEAWLSAPTVAPGEWVQVAVRSTNLGDDTAWQHSGECRTSGTFVRGDSRDTIPNGVPQTGNAAVLKRRLTRSVGYEWFPFWRGRDELEGSVVALAECGVLPGPLPLRPGAVRTEHFAWYAGHGLTWESDLWQPPYPGTVTVAVEWPFLARGARPILPDGRQPRTDTLRLTLPLAVTGAGPGTPSLPELVDRALADPRWAAWVDGDPTRDDWGYLDAIIWPGPDYPPDIVTLGDLRRYGHPDGVLDIELDRAGDRGFVLLDPWTGEVLDVVLPAWASPAG